MDIAEAHYRAYTVVVMLAKKLFCHRHCDGKVLSSGPILNSSRHMTFWQLRVDKKFQWFAVTNFQPALLTKIYNIHEDLDSRLMIQNLDIHVCPSGLVLRDSFSPVSTEDVDRIVGV